MINELYYSYDCLDCVYGQKSKFRKDRTIDYRCKLKTQGYVENDKLGICSQYKSVLLASRKPEEFLPYNVWIEITNKCNLKCRMCGQRGVHGYLNDPKSKMHRKDLTIEQWKAFIDDIKDFYPQVNIRGGEPLLYPKIIELCKYVKEQKLYLTVETNASILKDNAYDIAKYVDMVSISVDGPPEVHDYVRGVKGTYDRLKEGINAVKQASKEMKIKKLYDFNINTTISVDNYKALPRMVEVAKDLGVKAGTMYLSYFADEKICQEYEDRMKEKFGLDAVTVRGFFQEASERNKMDFDLLARNIEMVVNNKEGIKFTLHPYVNGELAKAWFQDPNRKVAFERCYSPWFMVNVMPNGDVNFCCDFGDYVIGNITEHRLLDLWWNEKARKFREEILKERFSICRRCGVNLLFPFNRSPAYWPVKSLGKVLNGMSKIPFLKRFTNPYTFIIKSMY